MSDLLSVPAIPDWEGLVATIMRTGKPSRVHHIELFQDQEINDAVCERYGLLDGIDPTDSYYAEKSQVAIQSFLGYDFVRCSVTGLEMPLELHRHGRHGGDSTRRRPQLHRRAHRADYELGSLRGGILVVADDGDGVDAFAGMVREESSGQHVRDGERRFCAFRGVPVVADGL